VGEQPVGKPLRVLFLTPYFRPYLGGIERAIEQLAFQLMASPAVETVAALTTKYSFPRLAHPDWTDRETTPEGIAIYRLKGFPKWSIPLYSVPLVWFSPFQIRRYLKEFDPDVVHFVGDGWFWGHIWSWLWFRRRAAFVFTPSFHVLPWNRWWLRPINIFVCNVMDRVVSLTNSEAGQVRRTYLVPRSKQEVIGWGATPPAAFGVPDADGSHPKPIPQRGGTGEVLADDDPEPLIILCVGRLGWHKGQEWLVEVYHQARDDFQRATRLVCVGRDEDAEEDLRRQIAKLGLEGEVSLTGEASDQELSDWYARSDIFALFSRFEAFGLVYFEAMAHGVPVLTHDVGANSELLVKGAVVTARFDKNAAAAELIRLVNDGDHRRQLGRQAREYAISEFTWQAVAEKYLDIYRAAGTRSH
jgi:glycosyltransferase involved in cell wall biosynthesis